MDLKQLQYFVVSVDSGSFKKASEMLYTSQPHVSKTIKCLEEELQVELLKRKARGVEVTEAGKKVYEYACRVLVEAEKIQNVHATQNVKEFQIASMFSDRLAELFRQFYAEGWKNGLHVQYIECSLEEVLKKLHRHTAEIGLICVSQKQITAFSQVLEYRRLEFKELARSEPVLLAGPESPLYHEDCVSLKELRDIRYVQSRDDQEFMSISLTGSQEDLQYYKRHGQVLVTNNRHLMKKMLMETPLCNISFDMFPEIDGCREIHRIPIRGTEENMFFGYVKRKRDELSREASGFIRFLESYLEKKEDGTD